LKQIRPRLTYANVMSTIGIFLVLAGGTAFAAAQLGKNSVGAKQLKKNAVTTAKLKKNAVTQAKIKKGAVTGGKIADGSIGAAKLNLASMPFGRVVARLRGSATVAVDTTGGESLVPLASSTYVQGPEEVNSYFGAVTIAFSPGCTAPREATGYLVVDPTTPGKLSSEAEIAALGIISDVSGGAPVQTMNLGPYLGSRFEPGTPTTRTVNLLVDAECTAGTGVSASNGAVDVVGVR